VQSAIHYELRAVQYIVYYTMSLALVSLYLYRYRETWLDTTEASSKSWGLLIG